MIVVDAMNVIGCVPDGWWRDRDGALRGLVEAVAAHGFDEWVVIVADGFPVEGLAAGTRGDVELRYAGRSDPDAADDEIVALVADIRTVDDEPLRVVTSDKGLLARLAPMGVEVVGPRGFRAELGW